MKYLFTPLVKELFVFSLFICSASYSATAQNNDDSTFNSENDTTIYTQVTITPGPDDSCTQRTFITFGCDPNSIINNAANKVNAVLDEICCSAWTYNAPGCDSGIVRSFQKFPQVANIPDIAVIDSAILILKGKKLPFISNSYGNSYHPGSPYNGWGTNESEVYRVTQNWSPSSTTWNNSPSYDSGKKAIIPPSTSRGQYDASIDVTAMVQDMVDSSTPYGFMFKLQSEIYYRNVIFYSSHAANASDRPELKIYFHYDTALSIKNINAAKVSIVNVYPNPAVNTLNVQFTSEGVNELNYAVYNMHGQQMNVGSYSSANGLNNLSINTQHLPAGSYTLFLNSEGQRVAKRFTKL